MFAGDQYLIQTQTGTRKNEELMEKIKPTKLKKNKQEEPHDSEQKSEIRKEK